MFIIVLGVSFFDKSPFLQSLLHVLLLLLVVVEPSHTENVKKEAPEVVEHSENAFEGQQGCGVHPNGSENDSFVLLLNKNFVDQDEYKAEQSIGHNPFAKKCQFVIVILLILVIDFSFDVFVFLLLNSFGAPADIIHIGESIDDKSVTVYGLVVEVGQKCPWVQHLEDMPGMGENVHGDRNNETGYIDNGQVFDDFSGDPGRGGHISFHKVVEYNVDYHDDDQEHVVKSQNGAQDRVDSGALVCPLVQTHDHQYTKC